MRVNRRRRKRDHEYCVTSHARPGHPGIKYLRHTLSLSRSASLAQTVAKARALERKSFCPSGPDCVAAYSTDESACRSSLEIVIIALPSMICCPRFGVLAPMPHNLAGAHVGMSPPVMSPSAGSMVKTCAPRTTNSPRSGSFARTSIRRSYCSPDSWLACRRPRQLPTKRGLSFGTRVELHCFLLFDCSSPAFATS